MGLPSCGPRGGQYERWKDFADDLDDGAGSRQPGRRQRASLKGGDDPSTAAARRCAGGAVRRPCKARGGERLQRSVSGGRALLSRGLFLPRPDRREHREGAGGPLRYRSVRPASGAHRNGDRDTRWAGARSLASAPGFQGSPNSGIDRRKPARAIHRAERVFRRFSQARLRLSTRTGIVAWRP
jgi:hypothetical protein